jgi:hypothetical protein
MATPTTSDFLVVPINGTDLIAFYRGSNISRPLYLSYSNFLAILTQAISGGAPLLLQTNSVQNPVQNVLNLIQGAGITITDNGTGGVTIAATGGGGGTYTVNNGLSPDPLDANNFQLGGTLVQNTLINTGIYEMVFSSIRPYGSATSEFYNLDQGQAIYAESIDDIAIVGYSNQDSGGYFSSDQGTPISGAILDSPDNNTVLPLIGLNRKTIGSATNGIGGSIQFRTETSTNTLRNSLDIKNYWTNVIDANRTSAFELWLSNGGTNARKLLLAGSGQLKLDNYTGSTFDASPTKSLGVDASGNVITFTGGGGGSSLNDTTGILFGGALSATIGGTTFSVTAGIGQIITQTASITGVVTTVSNVTWSAVTGAAITNIGTSQFTYVLVTSLGVVIQQTTPFTDAQYKTHIIIGILCHIDFASVNLVTNSQNVAYEDPHRLVELITSFGPIKKLGLNIGPNGANLRVNRTSGEAFKIGTNYTTDQFEPDVANISAKTPAKLCRAYGNNSFGFTFDTFGGLFYDDIDRNQYFNPTTGVLNSVGGSKWSIQRLFFFPNNPDDIICYYGVQTYNQFSEARANLEFETFDEATITAENAVFLGFLFVRHNATDLSDPNEAVFLQSGLFRGIPPGGGGSGGGGNSIGELTGDVTTPAATAPSQSVAATIANNAVTYAKMQAVSATSRLLGSSSTTTPVQEITIGGNLTLTGTTLTSSFLITYRRITSSSTLDSTDLTNVNTGVTYIIEMNVGTANTLTVPLNATIGFSIGSQITISQYGAGQTTIAAAVGVTLRSPGSFLKLAAQYSMCTLMKVDTNEWYVVGQLAP